MAFVRVTQYRGGEKQFDRSQIFDSIRILEEKTCHDQDDESIGICFAGSINLARRRSGPTEWEPGAERFHRTSGIPQRDTLLPIDHNGHGTANV